MRMDGKPIHSFEGQTHRLQKHNKFKKDQTIRKIGVERNVSFKSVCLA